MRWGEGAQSRGPVPKALVTGGAGFIGSHLVESLLASGRKVAVIDDLSTGRRDNLPGEADLTVASVLDESALYPLMDEADEIYHLAAIASVQKCTEAYEVSHRINAGAAVKMLEFLKSQRSKRFVYASSAAVYGDLADPLARETSPTRPRSMYGADKLTMEVHAAAAYETYGIRSVGLRFFNVYGPRQDSSSPYSGVITCFADRVSRSESVEIHGDGRQSRDFIYVADVVRALRAAGTRPTNTGAEIFNVCTGREVAILDLVDALGTVYGVVPQAVRGPARPGDIRRSVGSPNAALEGLGFEATTSLVAGLAWLRDAELATH